MKIKCVFFDLDDTLHDHQKPFADSVNHCFNDFSRKHSISALYKKLRHYSDELWKDYSQNKLTLEELRIQRIILALRDFSYTISREQASSFQSQYEDDLSRISLFPDASHVLNTIKDHGIQIGLITNGPVQHQKNKIQALNLHTYFPNELIFISDEVGIAKPNPELFTLAAGRVNLPPSEILYVGDTWVNDIIGPLNAGWNTAWYNHREREAESEHKPHLVIKSLTSLLNSLHIKK
ncbi:HAD family hydrolase [Litchfieldia salsa]|uniref:Putative hydrolase of the HAD superfamily n=1 Tax=Litchfieldia salsa TaxID=930152 RepID=A0A1H0X1Y6_9BACI|nr:HAD family hydrolase [Litchfieldia salsa]SDP96961.1 putative hydrolase of the HAD superfamily [Litchfieldia salsa]